MRTAIGPRGKRSHSPLEQSILAGKEKRAVYAAFAQFGSDLDAATQALPNRGARLTEVPKQPQYSPLPIEKQIVVIYAAVKGFCDRMPLDKMAQYERAIPSSIDPELLKSLKEKGGLTHERKSEPDASLKESALPYL